MLRIAHFSDTHFGGPPHAAKRCRRILDHLAAMNPPVDAVLVTGDITDHGPPQEYAEAADALGRWPGRAPLLTCAGNHDVRTAYAERQGEQTDGSAGQPVNASHDVAGVRFLMLDSLSSPRLGCARSPDAKHPGLAGR